jgi:hypothetical protein
MKNTARAYPLRRKFNLLLHRWHRRIGVMASLFVIWMVISGWLLNHTATLDLAHRTITARAIVTHYGLRGDIPQRAFSAQQHWLVADELALLDGKKIDAYIAHPLGMVASNHMLFVATATQLILLSEDGALVDNIAPPLANIEKIGSGCAGVVIVAAQQQLATQDGTAWSPCSGAVTWSRTAVLTAEQKTAVTALFTPGISLERLLLDLHSGRFFGALGPYFVDAIGLTLVLLTSSGLWLFARHRRRYAAHR